MHSLVPALTLTLIQALNHLANKPQQMTSALFGLMYPRTSQRTINIFTADYKYFFHFRKSRDRKWLPFFGSSERSECHVQFFVMYRCYRAMCATLCVMYQCYCAMRVIYPAMWPISCTMWSSPILKQMAYHMHQLQYESWSEMMFSERPPLVWQHAEQPTKRDIIHVLLGEVRATCLHGLFDHPTY